MRLLETKDKSGIKIYLTTERWRHIAEEHPEVAPFLQDFHDILLHPTTCSSYEYTEKVNYYYKYFKNPQSSYLLILVKYLNGEGFIITAYFTNLGFPPVCSLVGA